jgi:hypothetical protein
VLVNWQYQSGTMKVGTLRSCPNAGIFLFMQFPESTRSTDIKLKKRVSLPA